jgi:hypothetical protein
MPCGTKLAPSSRAHLLNGTVNLTEIVDAGVLLWSRTRLQKVGKRDGSQKTDSGHTIMISIKVKPIVWEILNFISACFAIQQGKHAG